ncbi:unnamed protein product [Amoebophrya sp. A120]|nr:unnamed protein product [Amoebophrya sp. A120]|eukprot:GSA120T00004303001.1
MTMRHYQKSEKRKKIKPKIKARALPRRDHEQSSNVSCHLRGVFVVRFLFFGVVETKLLISSRRPPPACQISSISTTHFCGYHVTTRGLEAARKVATRVRTGERERQSQMHIVPVLRCLQLRL